MFYDSVRLTYTLVENGYRKMRGDGSLGKRVDVQGNAQASRVQPSWLYY